MEKCTNCGTEHDGKFCPNCGAASGDCGQTASNALAVGAPQVKDKPASFFTGGAFGNALRRWLAGFVGIITLGFAYPAMYCWICRWEARHTYINGRRLTFDGKAGQLTGNFILWMLLSLITFGIYFMTLGKMKLTAWKIKHTHFEGVEVTEENKSEFTGKWYQLFGVNWLCNFVTVITLSFGQYWAHCYKERWYCKHKIIDGVALSFDGTGVEYFEKRIVWTALTVITLGIYGFWLKVKSLKWTLSHTHADEKLNEIAPEYYANEKEAKEKELPDDGKAVAGLVLACMPNTALLGLIISAVIWQRTREEEISLEKKKARVGMIVGIVMMVVPTIMGIAVNIIISG
ncbi:MAG: DUF898 family protein [Clostridia bacterium]|nr:DUF898 family protein [Clostridia bacterium]